MSKLNEKDFIKMANKIYIDPSNDVLDFLKLEYDHIDRNLENLKKIDVSNIDPLTRIAKPIDFLREDEVDETIILKKEIVLQNAQDKNDDYVVIKRILK